MQLHHTSSICACHPGNAALVKLCLVPKKVLRMEKNISRKIVFLCKEKSGEMLKDFSLSFPFKKVWEKCIP